MRSLAAGRCGRMSQRAEPVACPDNAAEIFSTVRSVIVFARGRLRKASEIVRWLLCSERALNGVLCRIRMTPANPYF